MRETSFIAKNKEKWLDFEAKITGKAPASPEDLSGLYIHLMNDLSYARTFYPKSKTILYLNDLAVQAFLKIYGTKSGEGNRLLHFFKDEVPLTVYRYRRYLYYAFAFFFLFVAIGVMSSVYDHRFIRLILGDGYVNMTLENIKSGDPLAVYKSGSNWGSHIGITLNNLRVGIYNYILGFFGGIGTLYILLKNSLMIGAFQYMFFKYGVFLESIKGIWIHGSMEIFAVVVEAAAGLVLGAGILFPRTYSRIQSLKIAARDSLKIFLSTFPFTIAAGFLEGYVTRYYREMPGWLSAGIILGTLGLISYYYLVYPHIRMGQIQFHKIK